jgi:radical SAM superfamily enzyme YgiQ (UPF0313 family)
MERYRGTLSVEEETRAIGVISSRGCPNRCVFCANSLNRRVRYRDPSLFVDEVQDLQERYGFPGLNFQDDSFTSSARHVERICREILRRKLNLRWYCSLRVDNVSRDMLALMKEAGCVALGYGIETGSDRLLREIRKGISTEQIRRAIGITRELGFRHVSLFLMTSLPGETREDIRLGSQFLSEMQTLLRNRTVRRVFLGTPTLVYPGTATEDIARKNGNVFPDGFSWNRYYETEKARVFGSNPYVPHFENPDFGLRDIRTYARRLDLRWAREGMWNRFLSSCREVQTLRDLGALAAKIGNGLPRFLGVRRR